MGGLKFCIYTSLACLFLIFIICTTGCVNQESWTAQQWADEGDQLADQGQYQQALDAYNQSIKRDQTVASVFAYRGDSFRNLNRDDEALIDFEHALSLNPDDSVAWQGKTLLYLKQEKYSLAKIAAEQVIRIGVGPVQNAWYLKGVAEVKLGKQEEGLRSIDKAIEIDPNREDFWKYKAFTLSQLGRNIEVLKCYEKLTEISPEDPENWNMKGQLYLKLGQINEANEAFSMAKNLIEKT